ncbi:MAG: DMT family transporter [Alphaproteobacteria bacterium]|nr:DMT family transporter [Alphaproteobacteria bacterium]
MAFPQKTFLEMRPTVKGTRIGTGVLWMLGATFLFVCQDSIARLLLRSYPTTEIAFWRFFIHLGLTAVFLARHNPRLMIAKKLGLQMQRSALLLATTLFGMLALKIMPLVDFSAVVWVSPVLVAALSRVLLQERSGAGLWASVSVGLIGVWMIIGRSGLDLSSTVLFPLLAAFANAFYQIVTRFLHSSDSPYTTLFYSALTGTLFCSGFLPFTAILPSIADGCLMLLLGILGLISHFCLIRAFSAAPANLIAPFGYTALLWANLFSLLIFGEIPSLRTLAGAGLIVCAGLCIFLQGRKVLDGFGKPTALRVVENE